MSRRISNPDGSFAGVAVLVIDLDYFHRLFEGLSLGAHGVMVLIGTDGIMIMRQPYSANNIGRDLSHAGAYLHFINSGAPEGSFFETASIDHVRRFYVFKRLAHLPLIVSVAEGEQDIYATWRRRAVTIGSLMVAFSLVFIGIAFLLAAQHRRRARAESELQLLARTDGLTGLRNRRTLGEVLEQEWRRARRMHSMFSLLFVDIDRFKAYNDTYGHQAGDDALTSVARCIEKNIRRPADTAARYGGEEFIVVLPDTSPAGAMKLGEKIRMAISEMAIEHKGSEYGHLTASIGTASWISEADGDISAVIHAADKALYSAKAEGRNKVCSSAHVPPRHMPDREAATATHRAH
jgi:diguanylate cyclase (GGDEF)-like protein